MTDSNKSPSKPRRRARKLFVTIGVLILLLVVLVALAPTLISAGVGHGVIRNAMSGSVNGSIDFQKVSLGWFGSQSITGLKVADAQGNPAADLNVTLDAGLLSLLLGADALEVTLDGAVNAEIREQGNTFTDLIPPTPNQPKPPAPRESKPLKLPQTTIKINPLAINLKSPQGKTLQVEKFTGAIEAGPRKPITLALSSPTRSGDLTGAISMSATITDLLAADGSLTFSKAKAATKIEATNLPVLLSPENHVVESFSLDVNSSDLTKIVNAVINADVRLADDSRGTIAGELSLAEPLTSAGEVNFNIANVTARLEARNLPTALAQQFLVGIPFDLDLSRDLGDTVELTAFVSEDQTDASGNTRHLTLKLLSFHANATVHAFVNATDGSIPRLVIGFGGQVHHELLKSLGIQASLPLQLTVEVEATAIPPLPKSLEPANLLALARPVGLQCAVSVRGPSRVAVPGMDGFDLQIETMDAEILTAAIGENLTVRTTGTIDQAFLSVDQSITGLIAPDGALAAWTSLQPVGTIQLTAVNAQTLAKLLPERKALIDEAMQQGQADVTITTSINDGKYVVDAKLNTPSGSAQLAATRLFSALSVDRIAANLKLTPALVAAAFNGATDMPALTEPATVQLAAPAFEIPGTWPTEYRFEQARPTIQLASDRVTVNQIAALAEPATLSSLKATIVPTFGESFTQWAAQINATTDVLRTGTDKIAAVALSVDAGSDSSSPFRNATITMKDVNVPGVETLLGKDPRAFAQWIGDKGEVSIALNASDDTMQATIEPRFARLTGKLTGVKSGDLIELRADEPLNLNLAAATLQQRLNPADPKAPQSSTVRVRSDVPLQVNLNRVQLPTALLTGDSEFDPTQVLLDINAVGGPLTIVHGSDPPLSIEQIVLTAATEDLRKGVAFTLRNHASAEGVGDAGTLDVTGRLGNLLNAHGALATEAARLQMNAAAAGVPTALADLVLKMEGLLIAALGPQLNGALKAEDFAFDFTAGQVNLDFNTDHGMLAATATGRDKALHIAAASPARAELEITPELRDRLLYKIHPLLADIRSTEQPLRAVVSSATIPAGGEVSRLNADMEITLGKVAFDAGSTTLLLLAAFDVERGKTIDGYVEPIRAKIRNGVVTYDRFAVNIDKYSLVYSGKVDLNTRKVELRTEVPFKALAMSIKEVRGIIDELVVPLVTHGTFGNLKTEVDPKFNLAGKIAEAAAKAGVKDLINKGLGDLLNKGKK